MNECFYTVLPVHDKLTEFYKVLELEFDSHFCLEGNFATTTNLMEILERKGKNQVSIYFVGHGLDDALLTIKGHGLSPCGTILDCDVLLGTEFLGSTGSSFELIAFCCSAGNYLSDSIADNGGRVIGFTCKIPILAKVNEPTVINFYKLIIEGIYAIFRSSNTLSDFTRKEILNLFEDMKVVSKKSKYRIQLRASLGEMIRGITVKGET